MAGVAITRTEFTAPQLRAAAAHTKDARASRRMLAIALVVEGADRTTAARNCGPELRNGSPDPAVRRIRKLSGGQFPRRTGASLQCRGIGRACEPPRVGASTAAHAGADGRACRLGRGRPRPGPDLAPIWLGTAWCAGGARTPAAPDRGNLRRRPARAYGRQATGGTRLSPVVGAPAAPEAGPGGTGCFQTDFPTAAAAAIPEHARGKPIEIWFQE